MILKICAKCSDLFTANLIGDNGKVIGEYDGYVPFFMPGDHGGDYVILDIDVDTGKILNWKKPTKKRLEQDMVKVPESEPAFVQPGKPFGGLTRS